MLAAMLRQSSGGGSGGGGVSGTKPSLGSRLSGSSLGSGGSARVSPDSADAPAADPHYIMQLVSDVRRFADVLLQLKEVFNSKGGLMIGPPALSAAGVAPADTSHSSITV